MFLTESLKTDLISAGVSQRHFTIFEKEMIYVQGRNKIIRIVGDAVSANEYNSLGSFLGDLNDLYLSGYKLSKVALRILAGNGYSLSSGDKWRIKKTKRRKKGKTW